jgi:hypothetical protein
MNQKGLLRAEWTEAGSVNIYLHGLGRDVEGGVDRGRFCEYTFTWIRKGC